MKFNSLIPELSVSDIGTSINFYTSIGFKIVYQREEDKFCFLQFEENQIMIEQVNNNCNTGALEYPFGRWINIGMSVENIDEYYSKLTLLGITFFRNLKVSNYKVDSVIYEDLIINIKSL